MGIAFFGNSSIKGSEILAAFPGAQGVDPSKDYRFPTLSIELPAEAASLPADGEMHELEWSFILPTIAEHDTVRTDGWRWSEVYDEMELIPSPIITLSFVLDGTRYFVSHNCFIVDGISETINLESEVEISALSTRRHRSVVTQSV